MSQRTLNQEGAFTPSALVAHPLLFALLSLEAEAVLRRKNPELYYEPALDAPHVSRDLSDTEELERRRLFEEAACVHHARLGLWRELRAKHLALWVTRLYRRYLLRSTRIESLIRRTPLAAGMARWLARQGARGAFRRQEARVFLYLMLKSAYEGIEADALDAEAWGAESFQAYLDGVTSVYDGRPEEYEPLVVGAWRNWRVA
jgi:hypothetical protein